MEHLTVQDIHKQFGSYTALQNISFSIQQGEFVCLLGPSGCGKTTLLRIIAGLEQPNSGDITMNGKAITQLPPAKRKFGIVFQSYALFPNLTAFQNVAYGLKTKKTSRQEMKQKVYDTLKLVNLEHIADRYPSQLSGGQQQRVALARALALSPDFLLLDEPLSALDAKVRVQLRNEIKKLQKRLGITTIMVTHDQEEALSMADQMIVMNDAKMEQSGTPQQVYDQPKTPFVSDFIGTINFIDQHLGVATTNSIAIRPEHIKVATDKKENASPATIEHMEFRGSSYRLMVLPLHQFDQTNDQAFIQIDLSAEEVHQMGLQISNKIYMTFPEDKLTYFGTSHSGPKTEIS
ncbi:putative 2-aminoethylphosphonate ABC transporter ATP-binding protein [Pontibacillus yanchengensis]|uniref:putative 2-aminoethylphosphonate ABC transporter ATP-binding protein n=1 Tax=Pontibacillus yanchengensis TaxID=462910 RepID=UPI00055E7388